MTYSLGFHHMGLGEEAATGEWLSLGDLTDEQCDIIAARRDEEMKNELHHHVHGCSCRSASCARSR